MVHAEVKVFYTRKYESYDHESGKIDHDRGISGLVDSFPSGCYATRPEDGGEIGILLIHYRRGGSYPGGCWSKGENRADLPSKEQLEGWERRIQEAGYNPDRDSGWKLEVELRF